MSDEPGRRGCAERKPSATRLVQILDQSEDAGATATEYALLVALVALTIFFGIAFFGQSLNNFFMSLASAVSNF